MRIAFFAPLNPQRSGISDYVEALLPHLAAHAEVEVFVEDYAPSNRDVTRCCTVRHWREFEADHARGRYDSVLYHMGNNAYHVYIYDLALRIPGVVMLHDFNLHYLVVDATVVRKDWDGYVREVEYNAGPADVARARRAQAGEVAPDYDGLPLNRRLLEAASALIVHSHYVEKLCREAGFHGPVSVIPHGAAVPAVDRAAARRRLDVDADRLLFGAFGFLKPYKRIASIIQAFARVTRYHPNAQLVLGGEEHPHYPLRPLIRDLGLEERVRILGHTPLEEFVENIAACDVCMNLRYPTAGESSGSLLREMALARPVIVSDIGAFSELPEDACIKIPPGDSEVEWLFEYMNTLANQPALAHAVGVNAAKYVNDFCTWERTAAQYAAFLSSLKPSAVTRHPSPETREPSLADYILSFSKQTRDSENYARTHLHRFVETLELTPRGGPGSSVLEMGCYLQMTPALRRFLGYEDLRGCYYGPAGKSDWKVVQSEGGEEFGCFVDLFDAEKDPYPYPDGRFDTVLCCELLEHLYFDPMHMMSEINRILKPGGHLVLSTPNITSLRALDAALHGHHPGFYHVYVKPNAHGEIDPRHNREYSPHDMRILFRSAGLEVVKLHTGWYAPPNSEEKVRNEKMESLLKAQGYPPELRGDVLYAIGRKTGPVRERWPRELYDA